MIWRIIICLFVMHSSFAQIFFLNSKKYLVKFDIENAKYIATYRNNDSITIFELVTRMNENSMNNSSTFLLPAKFIQDNTISFSAFSNYGASIGHYKIELLKKQKKLYLLDSVLTFENQWWQNGFLCLDQLYLLNSSNELYTYSVCHNDSLKLLSNQVNKIINFQNLFLTRLYSNGRISFANYLNLNNEKFVSEAIPEPIIKTIVQNNLILLTRTALYETDPATLKLNSLLKMENGEQMLDLIVSDNCIFIQTLHGILRFDHNRQLATGYNYIEDDIFNIGVDKQFLYASSYDKIYTFDIKNLTPIKTINLLDSIGSKSMSLH